VENQRLIVGVSGASGTIYAARLLDQLRLLQIESHLVITHAAAVTRCYETEFSQRDLEAKADVTYKVTDIGAAIASGSFKTIGMIVAPCSVKSLSEIAYCHTSNLLTRAADVCLKERRRLVLLFRETPLHVGHIRAMLAATEAGAIVAPPVPAFYAKPGTIAEMVDYTIGRILDLFDLNVPGLPRWGAAEQEARHR
jgi:flavin prenyltransferase